MTTQLQLDCSLFIQSKNILAVPVDKGKNQKTPFMLILTLFITDKYLAVYDGEQVKMYEFGNIQDCHLHESKVCENSEDLDLSSLHVYNMENPDTGDKSYLLIGVSNTNKSITTWFISTLSTGLTITYRGTKQMDTWLDPNVVVSASQWATNTASKLFHRLALEKKLVLTVSLGNDIIFYNVNMDQDIIEWEPMYTLDASQLEEIQQVRCAPSVVSVVSGKESKTLSIWMEMRSGVAPGCVKTLEFNEPICDMAWNVTSDAQFILAVAFPKSVAIFGQKRAKQASNDDNIWTCYTEFKVDT